VRIVASDDRHSDVKPQRQTIIHATGAGRERDDGSLRLK